MFLFLLLVMPIWLVIVLVALSRSHSFRSRSQSAVENFPIGSRKRQEDEAKGLMFQVFDMANMADMHRLCPISPVGVLWFGRIFGILVVPSSANLPRWSRHCYEQVNGCSQSAESGLWFAYVEKSESTRCRTMCLSCLLRLCSFIS